MYTSWETTSKFVVSKKKFFYIQYYGKNSIVIGDDGAVNVFPFCVLLYWLPLWSSGQSSWLQIRRPGFDSWHYQKKKIVVGLERGPLSLVSTTEELLDRKVAAPV
jgi:hypothetical protein